MITTIRAILLMALLLSDACTLRAQCKYEYKEKDVITNDLNFVTDKSLLSSTEKKEKVYLVKNIYARFEKKGNQGSVLINYNVVNTYGRLVAYTTQVDSLVMRFENGDIRAIKMNKMANINITSISYKVDLSYEMDEAMIKSLKAKSKIAAIRITSANFNIDISDPESDLVQKFNDCWIE